MFSVYQPEGKTFNGTLEQLLASRPDSNRNAFQPYRMQSVNQFASGGFGHLRTYQQVQAHTPGETRLPAADLMKSPVATIRHSASIRQAWQEMAARNVAQMPVLNDDLTPIGMLTWASLLKFVVFSGDQIRFVKGVVVRNIMWPELITAQERTDCRRIVSMMVAFNVNAVPISNSRDRLIGIISRSDILNLLAQSPALHLWV
ncbi:CBS domain-containing protein [Motiliproteus sediminis]|uniref:CBS domain-containing protein n=1 Tax=Motiliproteus sediminis TaxID=1468178 RepID=UPI001AEFEEF8|nr:CBS domain-containing protein [Motiliproteus sediminis]